MTDDAELLRRFAEENSDEAFRELVRNRIDFVYNAALRQVGGDAHLAQDVAQTVFLDLARKGRVLAQRPSIAGWLYTSTRFAAANALRTRSRRHHREQEAHTMQQILSAHSAAAIDWHELRPVLDDAMYELGEKDREAILLRFFENRPLAEVGAKLGLAENSARMRVDRALEKLRERLARRGITSTAAALGAAIATQPVNAAPAGLASTVAGVSLAGAAVAGGGIAVTLWTLELMNMTKLTIGIVGAIAGVGLGAFLGVRYEIGNTRAAGAERVSEQSSAIAMLREENSRLAAEVAKLRADGGRATASRGLVGSASVNPVRSQLDDLRLLTALQEKKWVKHSMGFVKPTGQLETAFIELFALTLDEQSVLQRAVEQAREQLHALEEANATVTQNEKGDVTVTIKPFVKAGGAVYDELQASFAQVLGPERNAAYLALGSEQVEKALVGFGGVERTVTFSYNPNAADGKSPYVVRDARKDPHNSSTNVSDYKSLEEVADRAGTVVRFLPPDFGRKK
jgi:RNA polymerase sigma factor (sigma-70 family)